MITRSWPCRSYVYSRSQGRAPLLRSGYYRHYSILSALNEGRSQPGIASDSPQSLYFDTIAPTADQADAASHFFQFHQPRKSWVADEWRRQAYSPPSHPSGNHDPAKPTMLTPEIAFLGRSNTGKSSLLNVLLHNPGLCRVGSKPGKTTTMHAWTLSANNKLHKKSKGGERLDNGARIEATDVDDRMTVLDMPGYGHGSRDEWGTAIVKYLTRRRQLRRAMVLLNPKHGIKEGDAQILQLLRTHGIPHQIVACKCDTIPLAELDGQLRRLRDEVQRIEMNGSSSRRGSSTTNSLCIDDVLAVGRLDGKIPNSKSEKTANDKKSAFGVDDVRWAILKAIGMEGVAVDGWTSESSRSITNK